ncbi:MAG TPA: hypothetical protein VHC72_04770 [Bryobacteraceae bacterium]|nr:hypothetical protein [Bryobacteraceae bacterium]
MPVQLLGGGEPRNVLFRRAGTVRFASLGCDVYGLSAPAFEPLFPLRYLVAARLTTPQMKQGITILEAPLRRLHGVLRRQVPAVIQWHAAPHCIERISSGIPFSGGCFCDKIAADAIANRAGYAKYGGLNPFDFHTESGNFRNIAGGETLTVVKPEDRTIPDALGLQTALDPFDQESAIDGGEGVFRGRQAEIWVFDVLFFPARAVLLSGS